MLRHPEHATPACGSARARSASERLERAEVAPRPARPSRRRRAQLAELGQLGAVARRASRARPRRPRRGALATKPSLASLRSPRSTSARSSPRRSSIRSRDLLGVDLVRGEDLDRRRSSPAPRRRRRRRTRSRASRADELVRRLASPTRAVSTLPAGDPDEVAPAAHAADELDRRLDLGLGGLVDQRSSSASGTAETTSGPLAVAAGSPRSPR